MRKLEAMGFNILSTAGTAAFLAENGVKVKPVNKLHEGRPNIVDALHNRQVQLLINTPSGKESAYDDSYIRKAAIKYKIPYVTTSAAAAASADGIAAARERGDTVKSLQEYHREIAVIASPVKKG